MLSTILIRAVPLDCCVSVCRLFRVPSAPYLTFAHCVSLAVFRRDLLLLCTLPVSCLQRVFCAIFFRRLLLVVSTCVLSAAQLLAALQSVFVTGIAYVHFQVFLEAGACAAVQMLRVCPKGNTLPHTRLRACGRRLIESHMQEPCEHGPDDSNVHYLPAPPDVAQSLRDKSIRMAATPEISSLRGA